MSATPSQCSWLSFLRHLLATDGFALDLLHRVDDKDFKKSSFRVVRMCCGDERLLELNTPNLEIFSSETGTWTESPVCFPREHLFGSCCAVDCKGILYWRFSSIFFVLDPYNPNHPHGTIDMPKKCDSKAGKHAVGECKGHLRFAQFKGYGITIWELDDNYSDGVEWSLVHMLLPKVHSIVSPLTVVAFHPRDSDILYLWSPDRIMHCNVRRSRKFKTVCELANSRASRFLYTMVFPFVLPWWPTPVPPIPHTVLG